MPSFTVNFDNESEKRNLWEHLKSLRGIHQITSRAAYKYRGRYKYYWAHVLSQIEEKTCIMNEYGEPLDCYQIHEVLKLQFNPIMYQKINNRIIIQGASTTNMSDKDFITEYEEQIIAEYSSPPYYCEFLTRDEWNEKMKLKKQIKNGQ